MKNSALYRISIFVILSVILVSAGCTSSSMSSDELYDQAVIRDDAGEYETAVTYYKQAARAGNGMAMLRLGQMYSEGLGVAQSSSIASAWFEKAAEYGYGETPGTVAVVTVAPTTATAVTATVTATAAVPVDPGTISRTATYGTKEFREVTYQVFYHQTMTFKDARQTIKITAEDMGSPTYIELKYDPELVQDIVISDGKEYLQDPSPKNAWFTLSGIPEPVIYGVSKNGLGSGAHRTYELVTLRIPGTYTLIFEGEMVDIEVTIFGAI